MIEPNSKINLTRNRWSFINYVVVILVIITFVIFISFSNDNPWINLGFRIISILILGFLLGFWYFIGVSGTHSVNSLKDQQFPHNLDPNRTEHDGFIVIHSMGPNAETYPGFSNLIPHYVKERYPFKIYHCYNPDDFKNALKNKNARYIWIFGHGWRGGITFKWTRRITQLFKANKTSFAYNLIRDERDLFPKKLFIGQFHCNNLIKADSNPIPLPEILLDPSIGSSYYVTDWKMNDWSIWFATRHLTHGVKRDRIPESDLKNDTDADIGCGCQ